nr:DUF1189 domain-containing protein [Brevibacillus laterosporus]
MNMLYNNLTAKKEDIILFDSLKMSLLKPKDLGQLVHKKAGVVFGFILFLALLISVFGFFSFYNTTNTFLKEAQAVLNSTPDFTFKDDVLNMQTDQPIFSPNNMLVFDPNNQVKAEGYPKGPYVVIFGKVKATFVEHGVFVREVNYIDSGLGNMTKQEFVGLVDWLVSKENMIWAIIFACIFIYMIFSTLFTAFIIGIFGYIVSNITKKELSFGQTFKMAVFSLPVPFLIKGIMVLLALSIPIGAITWGLAAVYIVMAVRNVKTS